MYSLVKNINQYNLDHVYFCDATKNNIMDDSNFIRIIYSNALFSLTGIYILLDINFVSNDKYFNKIKCTFDLHNYQSLITQIQNIEINILKKSNLKKQPQYKIYEQLKNGFIKVFADNHNNNIIYGDKLLLKIAGIWETETEFGLTYKFSIIC